MSSIKCNIGQFHVVVVQKTAKKCMKKVWCTCEVVVLPSKPSGFFCCCCFVCVFCFFVVVVVVVFLTFSLPWCQRIVKFVLVKSLFGLFF